jgi:hypothetical protein
MRERAIAHDLMPSRIRALLSHRRDRRGGSRQERDMSAKTRFTKTVQRRKLPVATQRRTRKRGTRASVKNATRRPVPDARSAGKNSASESSKQSQLIALLNSLAGATVAQMMSLTGWQAHSVRGVMSGILRKKLGLNVVSEVGPTDGTRVYRIAASKSP